MSHTDNPKQGLDVTSRQQREEKQVRRAYLTENVEHTIAETRRHRLRRMVGLTILFGVILIAVVLLLHDIFVKNEYIHTMKSISLRMETYRQDHQQKLPSQAAFLQFNINSRNLRIHEIYYDTSLILEQSPPETLLAYTPRPVLRLLPEGHVVLYLSGKIEWITTDTLEQLREERKKQYNRNILLRDTP